MTDLASSLQPLYSSVIVDTDENFLQTLIQLSKSRPQGQLQLRYARTEEEARLLIQNPKINIHSVFLNPAAYRFRGVRLTSYIHELRPVTPIYYTYEGQSPLSQTDLPLLAVHQLVSKANAIKLLTTEIPENAEKTSVQVRKKNQLTERKFSTSGKFIEIPAVDLMNGMGLFFDIYAAVTGTGGEITYEKVAEPKDLFASARVQIYIDRGTNHFYIKRESHQRLMVYCQVLSKNLLARPSISPELKLVETFNIGQDLIEEVKTQGIQSEHLETAYRISQQIRALFQKFQASKDRIAFKNFLNNAQAYDRAILCTAIAVLMGPALQFESESVQKNVSIATFFHDLGLYSLPTEIQNLKESEMNPDQKKIYYTHPERGAEIIGRVEKLDEVVTQAITQHHERKDQSGFPNRLGGSKINRLAEMIGIGDELYDILKEKQFSLNYDWMKEMETRVFPRFSFQIVNAFKTSVGGLT